MAGVLRSTLPTVSEGYEHGCIYCYACNSHEYWGYSAGIDFGRKIIVKRNAVRVLEAEFLKKNWQPIIMYVLMKL